MDPSSKHYKNRIHGQADKLEEPKDLKIPYYNSEVPYLLPLLE